MATFKQVLKIVSKFIPTQKPVLVQGPPGIGKTTMWREAATRANLKFKPLRLLNHDIVDLRGVPFERGGWTDWCPPLTFSELENTLLLLDELSHAPNDILAIAMEMIHEHSLCGRPLPDSCYIGAAMNRPEDTPLANPIPNELYSRFGTVITMSPNADETIEYFVQKGFNEIIIGYLMAKKEAVFNFCADRVGSFPCPRTWETANEILGLGLGPEETTEAVCGVLGFATGMELMHLAQNIQALPTMKDITEGNAIWPERSDHKAFIVASLSKRVTRENADKIVPFIEQAPVMFQAMFWRLAIQRNKEAMEYPGHANFVAQNSELFA